MEKYGYLISDLCQDSLEFLHIQNTLFDNITDCIKNALSRQIVDGPKRVIYFKILQNCEIVTHIHNDSPYENYGFCHLKRMNPSERFSVYSTDKTLCNNLLECISKAKIFEAEDSSDLPDSPNFQLKIGYFRVLNDTEIVQLLHRI